MCSFIDRLFLYSYGIEFVQKLLRNNNKKLAVSFNHTFRYIDDVLSINNHKFHNYVHLIYPDELEIKDTTESDKSASYLDILLIEQYDGKFLQNMFTPQRLVNVCFSPCLFVTKFILVIAISFTYLLCI